MFDTVYDKKSAKIGYRWYKNTKYGDITYTGQHTNIKRILKIPRIASLYQTIVPSAKMVDKFNLSVLKVLQKSFDLSISAHDGEGCCDLLESWIVPVTQSMSELRLFLIDIDYQVHLRKQAGQVIFLMDNVRSQVDGSYVGPFEQALQHINRGLSEVQNDKNDSGCTANIGYHSKDKKWFGWSHRAIYGFGVGSTCEKGDCGYMPSKFSELKRGCHLLDDQGMCTANCTYDMQAVHQDPALEGCPTVASSCDEPVPGTETPPVPCEPANCVFELGKGAWTAYTILGARQMACDFAQGVS